MVSREEVLVARAAAALTLQQFDNDARRLGLTRMVGRLARDRKYIVDSLKAWGGEPWPFSPDGDNSWVVG